MTDALACNGDVLPIVTLVVVLLHSAQFLALHAVEFALCKAITVHFLQLEEEVVESLGLAAFLGQDDGIEGIHFLDRFAVIATGCGEGVVGVEYQFGETVVEHVTSQVTHHSEHVLLRGRLHDCGQLVEFVLQCHAAVFRLFVRDDGYERFVVMVNRINGALAVVGTSRHICPECFYFRFDGIHIDISNDYDGLVIGSVPFLVIIAQRLVFEIIDDGGVAYDIAFGILGTRVHFRVQFFPYPTSSCTSCAPFLAYDASFRVYLFGQE